MSVCSFLDLPQELQDSEAACAVIVPIPLEKTTTYQRGTRNGPTAIIKASSQLEIFDVPLNQQTARVGIHTAPAINCQAPLKECIPLIHQTALKWFQEKKFPIFLGGEHSISIGIFKALKELFGPVTIVQIDAHADLRQNYHGSPFNHACVMSRAREEGHKIVQLGIRALSEREFETTQEDQLIETFFDHDFSWKKDQFESVLEKISGPVYLTVDVDGLDPTTMPATGTPVPGGLTWDETNLFIQKLFHSFDVIGADVNELRPSKEHRHCDFLCAQLVYRMVGLKAKKENWELKGNTLTEE